MGAKGRLRILEGGYSAYCPGCQEYHIFSGRGFNGDFDRSSFTPSLMTKTGKGETLNLCHAFITDGSWRFLSDCTHSLKSQTVELRNEEIHEQQIL